MTTITDIVKMNMHIPPRRLARETGLEAQTIHVTRWRIRNPERARAHGERYRRKMGMRSPAERSAEIDARDAEMLKMFKAGAATRLIGEKFGLTKNAVIGRLDRMRKRMEAK